MSFCGECGRRCVQIHVDLGIGYYEAWGRKGFDSDFRWVSKCCEATVFENEDLDFETDCEKDYEESRGDHLYDLDKEG